ncbi:hypothetical protein [Sphaerospermopsis aphanizomenoides]|uniref:hypothetical protein n=1 Tax=Sphaerospermopsis aphanizomenoides TaxID=459663 RepID=UPI0019067C1A|nr:hypothetical protein [Sphaerospermopsis aphanizomenoides]
MINTDDLIELQYLCEWMNDLPYKSFYWDLLPLNYFPDTLTGVLILHDWISREYRIKRRYAKVIWWRRGWGWRLSKDWKNKLESLSNESEGICSKPHLGLHSNRKNPTRSE